MAKRKEFNGDIFAKIAQTLHTTVNKIRQYRAEVQVGFNAYHRDELDNIPLSKDEAKEIISTLDKANKIDAQDNELIEYTIGLLKGDYRITSDNKLIKVQNLFEIMPFFDFDKKAYKMKIIQAEITPKFIKDILFAFGLKNKQAYPTNLHKPSKIVHKNM